VRTSASEEPPPPSLFAKCPHWSTLSPPDCGRLLWTAPNDKSNYSMYTICFKTNDFFISEFVITLNGVVGKLLRCANLSLLIVSCFTLTPKPETCNEISATYRFLRPRFKLQTSRTRVKHTNWSTARWFASI